jgi:hypothetical protein
MKIPEHNVNRLQPSKRCRHILLITEVKARIGEEEAQMLGEECIRVSNRRSHTGDPEIL